MQAQVKRRIAFGLTTGGLLAGGGLGFAHADAGGATAGGDAGTGNSPGVLSGNSIQIPVDVPINVCGVTANVLGLLNPASGNDCANSGGATASTSSTAHGAHPAAHSGTASTSTGGATARGGASHSPGVLSGNNVQIPVHIPVNACGDTVNVVGLKNVASGNHCANDSGGSTGATAHGGTSHSPGVLSGNNVQLPIDVPVNLCGDTVNVVGLLNAAKDNECGNGTPGTPPTTPSTTPSTSPSSPPTSGSQLPPPPGQSSTPSTPPTSGTPGGSTTPGAPHGSTGPGGETAPAGSTGSLAHTGSDALLLAPVGAAMIGGGFLVYRKSKPRGTH